MSTFHIRLGSVFVISKPILHNLLSPSVQQNHDELCFQMIPYICVCICSHMYHPYVNGLEGGYASTKISGDTHMSAVGAATDTNTLAYSRGSTGAICACDLVVCILSLNMW